MAREYATAIAAMGRNISVPRHLCHGGARKNVKMEKGVRVGGVGRYD